MFPGEHLLDVMIPATVKVQIGEDGKIQEITKQYIFDGLWDLATGGDRELFAMVEEWDGEWPGWDWR